MAITNQQKIRSAWIRRLLWLILIWTASVAAMLIAAYIMRLFMQTIGLHS